MFENKAVLPYFYMLIVDDKFDSDRKLNKGREIQ